MHPRQPGLLAVNFVSFRLKSQTWKIHYFSSARFTTLPLLCHASVTQWLRLTGLGMPSKLHSQLLRALLELDTELPHFLARDPTEFSGSKRNWKLELVVMLQLADPHCLASENSHKQPALPLHISCPGQAIASP